MKDKDLVPYLALLNPKVRSNVQLVHAGKGAPDVMLHVSRRRVPAAEFTPRIGQRQDSSEDRTVPRVCVSPDLQGCLVGHCGIEHSLLDTVFDEYDASEGAQGGGYIYAIAYDSCLRPSKKLVYDQDFTREHWLITYNKSTVTYKASLAGKFFITSLRVTPDAKSWRQLYSDIALSVTDEEGLQVHPSLHLDKGYYVIKAVPGPNNHDAASAASISYESLTASEFNQLNPSASLRCPTASEHRAVHCPCGK